MARELTLEFVWQLPDGLDSTWIHRCGGRLRIG
jgi:hypothetical protein